MQRVGCDDQLHGTKGEKFFRGIF